MDLGLFDRFEYKIIKFRDTRVEQLNSQFNVLGENGWELVTQYEDKFIFKRKLKTIIYD